MRYRILKEAVIKEKHCKLYMSDEVKWVCKRSEFKVEDCVDRII